MTIRKETRLRCTTMHDNIHHYAGILKHLGNPCKTSIPTFFFNPDSLHARLNSHYKAWSYMKKKHKKITAYRKSV